MMSQQSNNDSFFLQCDASETCDEAGYKEGDSRNTGCRKEVRVGTRLTPPKNTLAKGPYKEASGTWEIHTKGFGDLRDCAGVF